MLRRRLKREERRIAFGLSSCRTCTLIIIRVEYNWIECELCYGIWIWDQLLGKTSKRE